MQARSTQEMNHVTWHAKNGERRERRIGRKLDVVRQTQRLEIPIDFSSTFFGAYATEILRLVDSSRLRVIQIKNDGESAKAEKKTLGASWRAKQVVGSQRHQFPS